MWHSVAWCATVAGMWWRPGIIIYWLPHSLTRLPSCHNSTWTSPHPQFSDFHLFHHPGKPYGPLTTIAPNNSLYVGVDGIDLYFISASYNRIYIFTPQTLFIFQIHSTPAYNKQNRKDAPQRRWPGSNTPATGPGPPPALTAQQLYEHKRRFAERHLSKPAINVDRH